jgi:hypothetical protein
VQLLFYILYRKLHDAWLPAYAWALEPIYRCAAAPAN